MARTILAITASGLAEQDALVSAFAQAGFLQWAATGTVTFIKPDGTVITNPVTADPSDASANPSGALGWLDVLAEQLYDEFRLPQTYAAGVLYLVNTSASTVGPLATGQFHVAATTAAQPTYSNTSSLTLSPSTGRNVTAGSVGGSTVSLTLSSTSGLVAGDVLFVGVLSTKSLTGIDNTFQRLLTVNSGTGVVTFTSGLAAGTLSGTVTNGAYIPVTANIQADFAGPNGTAAPGEITQLVTTYPGVYCSNTGSFVGDTWESNVALAARCLLRLQSISPGGAAGAYAYVTLSALTLFAESAFAFSGNVLGTVNLSQAITKVIVLTDTTTGTVNVIVANATGAPAGIVQAPITNATNATPIVITIADTTGLLTGDTVYIAGVEGNTAANGFWEAGTITGTTVELVGSAGNGAYTTGGSLEGGDLGLLDLLLQERVVGQAVTESTLAASTATVSISATVTVPAAQGSAYLSAAGVALAAFFASFPIGGYSGLLPISVIEGILYAAGKVSGSESYVQRVDSLLLGGAAADFALTSLQNAVLGTVTITVATV
jgi:Baseplate J-like protein.